MELKRSLPVSFKAGKHTFNRTFMELKRFIKMGVCKRLSPFNRTFMELKRILSLFGTAVGCLLIAPLWN